MLKFTEAKVTFAEIPDEITLCINISNCPFNCKGCHSPELSKDIGKPLDVEAIDTLISNNTGISCVCFMGGDIEPLTISCMAQEIKAYYPKLKVGWYSGRDSLSKEINLKYFDYIKIGPYKEDLGPLNKETTNQRLYKVDNKELIDITNKFWKNV
jgi:anaerobic ribonucleoside-triphosphate reductase activating protein